MLDPEVGLTATERAESLALHRQRDPEANARIRLPDGESVDLACVWVGEVYLPTHVPRLESAFERLGQAITHLPHRPSPAEQLQEWRAHPGRGGWAHIGEILPAPIGSSKSMRRFNDPWWLPLAPGIEAVSLTMHQPIPGTTILVAECMLTTDAGAELMGPLRADYASEIEEGPAGGYSLWDPEWLQRRAVENVRSRHRTACAAILAQHFPGFFAAQGDLAAYPTADLLILENARLTSASEADRGVPYLRAIGLEHPLFRYRLAQPRGYVVEAARGGRADPAHLTFAVSRADAGPEVEPKDWEGYGGWWRGGVVSRVHHLRLLPVWTLDHAIRVVSEQFVELRDALGRFRFDDSRPAALWEVEAILAAQAPDVIPLLSATSTLDALEALERDLSEMPGVHPRRQKYDFGAGLLDASSYRAANASRIRAELVEAVSSLSSLVAARESRKVQERLLRLTVFLAIVGVLTLIATLPAMVETVARLSELASPTSTTIPSPTR